MENGIQLDVNLMLDTMASKVAELTKENTILKAQNDSLIKALGAEDDQESQEPAE